MKRKDDLFTLVHSLSKGEKRYFSLRAKQYSSNKEKNYLLLYDAILKTATYDEEKLRAALKRKELVKNFAAVKYQLYQLILDSLTEFRMAKSSELQLLAMLQRITTLQARGLFIQANSIIDKAEQLALKLQRHSIALEILQFKRRYIENSGKRDIIDQLRELSAREGDLCAIVMNQNEYMQLRARLSALHKREINPRNEQDTDELRAILAHKLLGDISSALSLPARCNFHRIHGEVALLEGRIQAALTQHQRLRDLWQDNPLFLQAEQGRFRSDTINYINVCSRVRGGGIIKELIDSLRELEPASAEDEGKLFQDLVYVDLLYCLQNGLFERGEAVVQEVEDGLKRFDGSLPLARVFAIQFNICLLYFLGGNFTKALYWSNSIQQHPQTELRRDIQTLTRILLPVIHFELGSTDILESLLRSAQRHLKHVQRDRSFENLLVRHLNKIAGVALKSDQLSRFKQLRKDVNDFVAANSSGLTLGSQELLMWVESKITSVPIRQVYFQRLRSE